MGGATRRHGSSTGSTTTVLAVGALGVVYGDIGTNPLFAMREAFEAGTPSPLDEANVLGLLSLMFWSLILVICVKYLDLRHAGRQRRRGRHPRPRRAG